ncbi:pleiotropic drug resistance protein 1-like [Trifolium medium]|uniref:Pleiotropic drug resistance protein 1-like n=1 Tax=Trifolium medium TaxID=97028 RepID=A0A392RBE7_9FABA|nr:pleiotropic drug resistance protein 1-like [Trifolium medium]
MDIGDIYRASRSFTRFSRREEDDEEALKWAAIEKLRTYNRLKKGLLATSHGVANEIIDVIDLDCKKGRNC